MGVVLFYMHIVCYRYVCVVWWVERVGSHGMGLNLSLTRKMGLGGGVVVRS